MPNLIFYFTGTGNSLAVARSIAKELQDTAVVPILNLREKKIDLFNYETIGFVFPCFYIHTPEIVMGLIKDIDIQRSQSIFAVVTYGGTYGYALSDFAEQLQDKTDSPIRTFSVRMPGSHIVGYSAFPEWLQKILFQRAAVRVRNIAAQIQAKEFIYEKKANRKPLSVSNGVVKFLNKRLGVKDIQEKKCAFSASHQCVHCGICQKICPVQNISVTTNQVVFGEQCMQFMACIQWCPQQAITHPNIPLGRAHYHHPDVTVREMIS